MAATRPAGWTPKFPDQESVMMDLIQSLLNEWGDGNLAGTWIPDAYTSLLESGNIFVRVHRMGPGIRDRVLDVGTIQCIIGARTRAMSNEVAEFLRERMIELDSGEIPNVNRIEEFVAPAELFDLPVDDDRLVQSLYTLTCRKIR